MPRLAILYFAAVAALALTPEQAIQLRRISSLTLSPDQTRVACVVSEVPKGAEQQAHIWMLDIASGEFRQFTFSAKSESAPAWSPDGKTLAFLSSRGEHEQIYLMRLDGGEAAPLTSGKNGVSAFHWSPDGSRIAFLAPQPKSDDEEKKEKDKDDAKVYDREQELSRLWTMDLASKKPVPVTKGAWRIAQFDWISAGKVLAVASNQPKAETWNSALYEISLADGAFHLFGQPKQPFGGLSIAPDRRHLAFAGTRTGGPDAHDLFIENAAGGEARDVTAAIDRNVTGVKWPDGEALVVSVADGFRTRLYRVPLDGSPAPISLAYSNGDFAPLRNGAVVYVGQSFDRFPELFLQAAAGEARQLSHLHKDLEAVALAKAEVFRFKSFDGKEVEGALMKPPGTNLPLILYVHGGPAGNFSASFYSWAQILVSRGYQVLFVNPRGSTGYGEEFLKANYSDWGGGDFKDLMAGLDAVLARGETDATRLGIGGWSYGGYMAEWAITQTNRFKAAVSGAGMFDLAAEFGTEVGPEGDEWYFGTPWETPDRFAHSSPYLYIKNAKTPTLILQGENDPIDPLGQSTALYRALKRYGVETELVTYPREPHGPREEKHQLDILHRMADWFDHYLKPPAATSTGAE
jgi:dipeptidyl aminopeptidase/acylaminoacyl peptidase